MYVTLIVSRSSAISSVSIWASILFHNSLPDVMGTRVTAFPFLYGLRPSSSRRYRELVAGRGVETRGRSEAGHRASEPSIFDQHFRLQ